RTHLNGVRVACDGVEDRRGLEAARVVVATDRGARGATRTVVHRDLRVDGGDAAGRDRRGAGRRGGPGEPDVVVDDGRAEEVAEGFGLTLSAGVGDRVVEGVRAVAGDHDGRRAVVAGRRTRDDAHVHRTGADRGAGERADLQHVSAA